MSIDFHVAVRQADWPTPAALNRLMDELRYPVRIIGVPPDGMDKPLTEAPDSGLLVEFEGEPMELEGSVTRLGPSTPYAYGWHEDVPVDTKLVGGFWVEMRRRRGPQDLVAKDINADLREIGARTPNFVDGDYVLTLSFGSDPEEYRAGGFLMAGLIKCANGLGFEFHGPSFGGDDFAEPLAKEAADPNW